MCSFFDIFFVNKTNRKFFFRFVCPLLATLRGASAAGGALEGRINAGESRLSPASWTSFGGPLPGAVHLCPFTSSGGHLLHRHGEAVSRQTRAGGDVHQCHWKSAAAAKWWQRTKREEKKLYNQQQQTEKYPAGKLPSTFPRPGALHHHPEDDHPNEQLLRQVLFCLSCGDHSAQLSSGFLAHLQPRSALCRALCGDHCTAGKCLSPFYSFAGRPP